MRRDRVNSVILSGTPEAESENVSSKVVDLHPGIGTDDVLDAVRLGRKGDKPRLIKAKLSPTGKQTLFLSRRDLKIKGTPVYVNHDLTPQERSARQALVLQCKMLRGLGVSCSLPRDKIVCDGKPMSANEIALRLGSP